MQELAIDLSTFKGRSVLALGTFDGIHIGQQKLLSQVVQRASELNVPSGIILLPHADGVRKLTTKAQQQKLYSYSEIVRPEITKRFTRCWCPHGYHNTLTQS